jgi:ABC-2 type transport system permease protein
LNLPILNKTTIDLIVFESIKNLRQKYLLIGASLITIYTLLSSLGFITHRLIHKKQQFEGISVAELMNGLTFCLYCLVPAVYMLMPMLLGTFTAMSFAGEMEKGQMRTILLRPISRWRIFFSKFVTMSLYSLVLFIILLFTSYLLGAIMFGPSGNIIVIGQIFQMKSSIFILEESIAPLRTLAAYGLAFFSSLYLIAMYLMFAAVTRKIAYTLVFSHGIYYISYVLLSIPFMNYIHPFLPTKYLAVWKFPVMENIPWERLTFDLMIDAGYIVGYLAAGGIIFCMSDV